MKINIGKLASVLANILVAAPAVIADAAESGFVSAVKATDDVVT